MKKTSALFSFPTEVIFVDDDPFFLKSLNELLGGDNYSIKIFTDPQEALDYINGRSQIESIFNLFLKYVDHDNDKEESEYKSTKTVLESLYEKLHARGSVLNASVVFVDFHMKEMNGISFCKEITNPYIKKVIITAGMEEGKALKAFNENIIDFFVSKKEEKFCDTLSIAIDTMKYRYFTDLSSKLAVAREVDGSQAYQDEFSLFLKERQIVEYYAIDELGSYICFDFLGKKHLFLCSNDSTLNELLSIAQACDAEDSVIKALQAKTHGVFLLTEMDKKKSVKDWINYLNKFKGNFIINGSHYYFANTEV